MKYISISLIQVFLLLHLIILMVEQYLERERVKEISKVENYFKEAISENIITSSNVLVKKNAFNEVGLFNENLKYGEDLDLWYRLAQKFDIIKSTKITAVYRVDAENRSDHKQNLYKCFEYYIRFKKHTQ